MREMQGSYCMTTLKKGPNEVLSFPLDEELQSGDKSETDGGRTEGGASGASSQEREVVSAMRPRNFCAVT